MKQILSFFVLVCVSLGAMASNTSVLNAEGVEIWYDFDSSAKTASVTYMGSSYYSHAYTGEVVIPSTVTYKGEEYSLTSIGDYAFRNCSSLTSITLPDGLTSIGKSAFWNCSSLTSITLPDGLTSIGNYAFEGCYRLYEVYNKSDLTITAGSSDNGYVARYAKNVFTDCEGESKLKTEGDYIFYIDGEDIELIAYTGNETSITLPSDYEGKSYNIGDYAFYNCSSLTSITLPDGLKSIGNDAFSRCYRLYEVCNKSDLTITAGESWNNGNVAYYAKNVYTDSEGESKLKTEGDYIFYVDGEDIELIAYTGNETSITLPSDYEGKSYNIGDYAFYNCSSLTSITLPDGLTSIGYGTFQGCSSLTSITLPDGLTSIGNSAFEGCSSLTSITLPDGLKSIGGWTFWDCSSLTSITLPDGLKSIGNCAFQGCSSLTSITLPDGLTSIGSSAFYGTAFYDTESNWEEGVLYIGDYLIKAKSDISGEYTVKAGTTLIGDYAFRNCSSLTSITLPDGLTSMGEWTFAGCSSLASITLPDGLMSMGNYAFDGCSSLTSITLPDDLTSIGEGAFSGCSSLTSITLPDGLTSIGDGTFAGCSSLASITLSDGLTSIGISAFSYCSSLTSITLPDGLTSIGEYAFWNCSSLTSITLPDGLTSIGNYAFEDCSSLTSITLPDGLTLIGDYAFRNCSSLTSITLPESLTSIGYFAFQSCSSLTSITLPDGLTSIGDYAFQSCSSLTSITLPDGLTSIGDYAFSYCSSLTSITLPDGLTSIGEAAFYYCSSLTSITLPESLTSIGNFVFQGCSSLTSITLPDGRRVELDGIFYDLSDEAKTASVVAGYESYVDTIVIPEKVTYNEQEYVVTAIGDNAFYKCNDLKHVTIPNTVTSIGEGAFYQCWWLKEIQIPNSVVTVGANAFRYCSGLTFLTLPSSVVSIGDDAFKDCYKLREIYNQSDLNIVAGSETYGNIAYYATNVYNEEGANKIKLIDNFVFYEDADNVVLLGQLTDDSVAVFPDTYCGKNYSIGESAFEGHTFTSITLPDGLTSIGNNAFAFCYALTSIISKNTTPPTVEYGAFNYLYNSISVYVPKSSVEAYKSAYGWSEFTNIQAIDETASSIIDSTTDSITVRINGNEIVVEGTDNYTVYSIAGQSLGKTESVEKGIYIVVVNGKSYKVVANK